LWHVKTHRNIHRGGIKNKNKYAFIMLHFLCIIENKKNIEKEIVLKLCSEENQKQSQRL
jgi:hypothetical protein